MSCFTADVVGTSHELVIDFVQGQLSFALLSLGSYCNMNITAGQSVPLGLLAASTLRMKCFWSPYICVLASAALADPSVWSAIVAKVCFVTL